VSIFFTSRMNLISSDDENWRHGVFVYILEAVTAHA
jgi:hypothetical protein